MKLILAYIGLIMVFQNQAYGWWARRRRRNPPAPPARNCVPGAWRGWDWCSHQCGNAGTQTRTRGKTVTECCGGTCNYHFSESRQCNRDACRNGGRSTYGRCNCKAGWTGTCCERGRQWTYQTCTEFGFYQTSDSTNQPFGNLFPLKVSIKQCMDIFGPPFNETQLMSGIASTNTNYGGLKIAGTKIVFPNGSIDPWHALGIISDVTPEEQAVFIEGTAHCANMYPELSTDPPQLTQARLKIKDHIANCLT